MSRDDKELEVHEDSLQPWQGQRTGGALGGSRDTEWGAEALGRRGTVAQGHCRAAAGTLDGAQGHCGAGALQGGSRDTGLGAGALGAGALQGGSRDTGWGAGALGAGALSGGSRDTASHGHWGA